MTTPFTILKNPNEILPYLDTIKNVTDANRDAFGFLSIGAYEDAIKNGKLGITKLLPFSVRLYIFYKFCCQFLLCHTRKIRQRR